MAEEDARTARARARWRVIVPAMCVAAAAAVCLAMWVILDGRSRAGGVLALVAGVLLVVAGVLAPRTGGLRARMLLSFVDRGFDGAILAAVAWVVRASDPQAAGGALFALVAGFLAAYVRARAAALGYLVEEGAGTRAIRCGLIALALLAGFEGWALFAVGIWMLLVTLVRVSQVAKEERA